MTLRRRLGTRRIARRVAAVDAYEFPSSVRQRLRLKHPDLQTESAALVETALRQWFRLLARRPSVRLSMPSVLVDDMWHEFLLHTRDYAAFCDAAFGQFLHHEPESTMTPEQAAANRSDRLLLTLRLARQDENCGPGVLPLLFRVDQEVGLEAPHRRYLADCGGRGQCYEASLPDWVCLQHLAGPGRPLSMLRRKGTDGLSNRDRTSGGGGCFGGSHGDGGGGGCGGGCGGG
ncbi:MAG: hypothetical protein ABR608_01430 [Pseudonocardiaceae bacterium]